MKERGWNKVRHRQSSLSIWRESQNCPSTKIYQTHTCKPDLTWLTYTHIALLSILSSLYFLPPFPLFVSLFLPPLPSSKQGQPRLFEFWMLLTSFVHLINSFKLPLCLVFLPHPVLFTHHNGGQHNLVESWTDSRHDSVWPGYSDLPILICFWAITNVWLNVFFLLSGIETGCRRSQLIFSLQAQSLTILVMN